MKIIIEYKNKDLETVNIQEYSLEDYCLLLSQKQKSLLYQIEDYVAGNISFKSLRHHILDIAGEIKRLPENLK